jgi:RNA polymerase sigma-70 factor (ECF subfamily)
MSGERQFGALIDQARAGDRDATAALVRAVEPALRDAISRSIPRALRRRVGTDDLLQATLLVAIDQLPRFEYRGDREFVAWITTIAAQRIHESDRFHRAQKRDRGRDRSLSGSAPFVACETSPTQSAARAEQRIVLRDAVAKLPDDERRVVELRTFEGLAFREIATRLGLSDRHAAMRAFERAMERLARIVGEP